MQYAPSLVVYNFGPHFSYDLQSIITLEPNLFEPKTYCCQYVSWALQEPIDLD
jgi:hypothetical protein